MDLDAPSGEGPPRERLVVVDGNFLLNRAFHALPRLSRDSEPTGALFGFARALLRIRQELPSVYTLVALDGSGGRSFPPSPACWRAKRFPKYKAKRPPTPEALSPQLARANQLSTAMGVRTVVAPRGYEADDVIAACVAAARAQSVEAIIVSADKDLMQLVRDEAPSVKFTRPHALPELIDEAWVCGEHGIARPELLADLLALAGDSADGLPGIPGIGPKLGALLLAHFGDLEGVLAAATPGSSCKTFPRGFGPKRLAAMREHAEDARLFKELVDLTRATGIRPPALEECKWPLPDYQLRRALAAEGFPSFDVSGLAEKPCTEDQAN